MLKVYLDKGEQSAADDGIVTVAAVIFRAEPFRQFVRAWKPMLKRWNADAFHATDFYSGYKAFSRFNPDNSPHTERTRWFEEDKVRIPTIIGANALQLTAVAFRPDEYRAASSGAFKQHYGTSVHSLATQTALIINGWWAKEAGYSGRFAYFMESGDGDGPEVVATVESMRKNPDVGAHIRVSSFTQIDKGESPGLEAADCFAWHWNKYYMDRFRLAKQDVPARKDLAAMMRIAEGRVYASLIVGDKLTYFLGGAPLPEGVSPFAEGFSAPPEFGVDKT
jgi:hypothetical protein